MASLCCDEGPARDKEECVWEGVEAFDASDLEVQNDTL